MSYSRAQRWGASIFLGSLKSQTGRCTPPRPSQRPPPKKTIWRNKCFPSGPNSGRQGRIFFHWAKLHPTELHFTLLSYAASSWATLHPNEPRCTLLSYAAPHYKLCCIQQSYAAPSELSCALLSYAAPFWATLHPTELRLTLHELRGTLKI
jgi:hypothetical protein